MKEDIKIYPCKSPTKDNPESYRLKITYKDKQDQKRVKQTFPRFKNKREAIKQKTQWALDYANDAGFFAPPKAEPEPQEKVWTFREFAKFYWSEKKDSFAASSRPNRKWEVDALADYFKDAPLAAIDNTKVSEFRRYLENKPVKIEIKVRSKERVYNPETKRKKYVYKKEIRETPRTSSSVNHYLVRLRAMLQVAEDFGFIEKVPKFSGIIETAKDNKRDLTITFEELEKLIAHCRTDDERFREERDNLRLLIIGLFETGARLAEVREIRRKDISFEHQTALVLNSKRRAHKQKTYRFVYLSEYLRQALIAAGVKNLPPDALVFTQSNTKRSFQSLKRRAGINPAFTLKDMRHCLPTNLAMCGVDEMIIERQIGHNVKGLLKTVYINFRQDYLVAEMQKYERFSKSERSKLKAKKRTATAEQSVAASAL